LSEYTGSADRVYNYDKNAEFAKKLLAEVAGPNCIKRVRSDSRSAEKSSEKSLGKDLLRDIGSRPDNTLKQFEGEKVMHMQTGLVMSLRKSSFIYMRTSWNSCI
uniref:Doublecortin domain-containing protein n=1 Tax=Anisakis simplex TaxID=6269 RepID=A0A0M3JPY7_ANISI